MLVALAIYLFLVACLAYRISGYDILSPTFVLSALFLFCDIFAIIANQRWGVTIVPELLFVFIVAFSMLQIGEIIAISLVKKNRTLNFNQVYSNSEIRISTKKLVGIIIIDTIILILYYRRLVEMASSMGYSNTMLLQFVRVATINNDESVGAFFAVMTGIISASGYCCLYVIINNLNSKSFYRIFKEDGLLLIPVLLLVISSILSGARSGLIAILVFVFVVVIILKRNKLGRIKIGRVLIISCITVAIFLYVFVHLGKLTGKTTDSNAIEIVFTYVGSSIVGLSRWLEKGIVPSRYFGIESFWGIRYFINKIFPSFYEGSPFLEGILFTKQGGTNIYTAFRSYLADFGYVGLALFMFLIGFIYTFCYIRVREQKKPLAIILYAWFFYKFVYIVFTPSITSSLMTSSMIFGLLWIVILYWLLIYKSRKSDPNCNMEKL